MSVFKDKQDSTLTVKIEGRLDTTTVPVFDTEIKDENIIKANFFILKIIT